MTKTKNNSAADVAALDRALLANLRPRATGSSRGLIVSIPSINEGKATYKSLIDAKGDMTAAGTYFFRKLAEEPPNRKFNATQQTTRAAGGRSEQIWLNDGLLATVRTRHHLKNEWRGNQLGRDV